MIVPTWQGPEPDINTHSIGTVSLEPRLQYHFDQVLRIMLPGDNVALANFTGRGSRKLRIDELFEVGAQRIRGRPLDPHFDMLVTLRDSHDR